MVMKRISSVSSILCCGNHRRRGNPDHKTTVVGTKGVTPYPAGDRRLEQAAPGEDRRDKEGRGVGGLFHEGILIQLGSSRLPVHQYRPAEGICRAYLCTLYRQWKGYQWPFCPEERIEKTQIR
jgi:hypothetical protein